MTCAITRPRLSTKERTKILPPGRYFRRTDANHLAYDVTIIDTKLRRSFRKFFIFAAGLFNQLLRGASVTHCDFSAFRRAQVNPFSESVTVMPETFAVALRADNTPFRPDARSFTSQAAANDFIARAVAADRTLDGTLHVLPQFEMAA